MEVLTLAKEKFWTEVAKLPRPRVLLKPELTSGQAFSQAFNWIIRKLGSIGKCPFCYD